MRKIGVHRVSSCGTEILQMGTAISKPYGVEHKRRSEALPE